MGEINEHSGPIALYRCPGCWAYTDTVRQEAHQNACMLHRSLIMYETSVRDALKRLVKLGSSEERLGSLDCEAWRQLNSIAHFKKK